MVCIITANTENIKATDAIKRKIVRNAQNNNCQTHLQATMIRLKKVIVKARHGVKKE